MASTNQVFTVGALTAGAAYFVNKMTLPRDFASFLKADTATQLGVGSLAGMWLFFVQ